MSCVSKCWVTDRKQCTDLDWLDEEVRVSSFFAERKAGNSDSNLRQYADVLRAPLPLAAPSRAPAWGAGEGESQQGGAHEDEGGRGRCGRG